MGIDYAWPKAGDKIPIYSWTDGVVTRSGRDTSGFGFRVVVTTDTYEIYYAHLSRIDVRQGDKVSALQQIGVMGNSGSSTGVHLHLWVRKNGEWLDPGLFLQPRPEQVVKDPLLAEAVEKGYWNGKEWDWVTERNVIMTMKTAKGESAESQLGWIDKVKLDMYNEIVDSNYKIDYSEIPDAGLEDNISKIVFVEDTMTLAEIREVFWKCQTNYLDRILVDKELQLNQDEFKKKSKRCTIYNNCASATHYWIDISKRDRRRIIDRYIDKKIIGENSWVSTIEMSKEWWKCLNDLGIYTWSIETYVFRTGSFNMGRVMFMMGHYFVTSTVLSSDLRNDRKDHIINWDVHGGDEYGGHSHGLCAVTPNLLMRVNSYAWASNNHAFMKKETYQQYVQEKRKNWYTYARQASCVHLYK